MAPEVARSWQRAQGQGLRRWHRAVLRAAKGVGRLAGEVPPIRPAAALEAALRAAEGTLLVAVEVVRLEVEACAAVKRAARGRKDGAE